MSSQQLRVLLKAKPVNTLEWRAWGLLSLYPEGGAMNNWWRLGGGVSGVFQWIASCPYILTAQIVLNGFLETKQKGQEV